MTKNKKFNIQTLGCKVNKYDSEAIVKILTDNSFEEVDNNEVADIYIINTCSVTNLSEKKSRQIIRRAKKSNPEAIVVACGCYSQVSPEEVANIEEVDIVLGTKDRMKIVELIEEVEQNKSQTIVSVSDVLKETYFDIALARHWDGFTKAIPKLSLIWGGIYSSQISHSNLGSFW